MKKIIFIIAVLTFNVVQAEYVIKVPMEKSKSGALPDNSIIFKNGSSGNPETPSVECNYEMARTFWGAGKDSNTDLFFTHWNGFNMTYSAGYDVTSITYEGVKYTRGEPMDEFGDYIHYSICKEV